MREEIEVKHFPKFNKFIVRLGRSKYAFIHRIRNC